MSSDRSGEHRMFGQPGVPIEGPGNGVIRKRHDLERA